MAETINGITYTPNQDTVILKLVDFILDDLGSELSEKAYNDIISAWDKEKGYNSAGNLVKWKRSEKSTRENSLMFDTGFLQSQLRVEFIDNEDKFKFKIYMAGGKYPDRPDRNSSQVSQYLEEQGFPHLNIPKKYKINGNLYKKIQSKAIKKYVVQFVSDGSIKRA